MIDPEDRHLSVSRQSELLGVCRSRYYYRHRRERRRDIDEKILLKKLFLQFPFYGYRRMVMELRHIGHRSTVKRVRRLMHELGLRALSPKQLTSRPTTEHPTYPYLLKHKRIRYPNQVWATDITYLKLDVGFVYLVAIMDVYSRKVLSWRVSLSMDAEFCIEALNVAMQRYGVPAILNTDHAGRSLHSLLANASGGSQFTSYGFIKTLKDVGVAISMDGQGRWRDNIYVERLWRSLKSEDIYLKSYESVRELKRGLGRYFRFCNERRYHQNLEYQKPDEMYESFQIEKDPVAA